MPKLLAFLACEKVIIDHRQVPSLISLYQKMQITLQDAPLPDNALSPTQWNVFALWQHAPEEIGIEFHQRVEVYLPNGQLFAGSEAKFKVISEDSQQSRNIFQFFGIPINDEGFIRVATWLNDEVEPRSEFRFFVEHVRKEQNEQTAGATGFIK